MLLLVVVSISVTDSQYSSKSLGPCNTCRRGLGLAGLSFGICCGRRWRKARAPHPQAQACSAIPPLSTTQALPVGSSSGSGDIFSISTRFSRSATLGFASPVLPFLCAWPCTIRRAQTCTTSILRHRQGSTRIYRYHSTRAVTECLGYDSTRQFWQGRLARTRPDPTCGTSVYALLKSSARHAIIME